MADDLKPYVEREFKIGNTPVLVYTPPEETLLERLKEFWYYVKKFRSERAHV